MPLPAAAAFSLAAELWRILRPTDQVDAASKAIEKAAPVLFESARKAVPAAVNEQQAVEQIKASPQLQTTFKTNALTRWDDLAPAWEAAERSRQTAREFNRNWDGDRLIFGQFRFVELLSLILLLVSSVGGGFVLVGEFPAEMKGAVITLMLIAGFSGVKEFWLGSSRDSQRKTELLNDR